MAEHFIYLLDELMRQSLRMASAVEQMLGEAIEAVTRSDHTLARRIIDRDEEIDREEVEVEKETLRLMTLFQPMGKDMRLLAAILKVNSDLERVADCAVNMAERARHLDIEVMDDVSADLHRIYPVVREMLRDAVRAYATRDDALARNLKREDALIDAFYADFIRKVVAEAMRSPDIMAAHLDILSIAKNLERIADHATNIAENVIFMVTGTITRHGFQTETTD